MRVTPILFMRGNARRTVSAGGTVRTTPCDAYLDEGRSSQSADDRWAAGAKVNGYLSHQIVLKLPERLIVIKVPNTEVICNSS